MKNQTVFALLAVLVFALSSCGTTPPAAPTTLTLLPTQQTVIPTEIIYPTFTSTPLATAVSYPTVTPLPTEIPYPTASVVKSNAVAFIAENALWVANVDGSGERRLADVTRKDSAESHLLQWSPNGEWISYRSEDGLWIISRDGSVKRKLLSFTDENAEKLYTYIWSPDSSQIAYMQTEQLIILGSSAPVVISLLNLETGKTAELYSYKARIPAIFLWSPNGRYLLLSGIGKKEFSIFDIATREVIKDIKATLICSPYLDISWSPNSNWFYSIPFQNGRFATTQICVAGLDGSLRQIDINGTATSSPVWDKTGNFLYFVASNTNFSYTPIPDYDLRLMRYDVRTQKLERVISLGKENQDWSVAMSPDGNTLLLQLEFSHAQDVFTFVNIESLSQTKFKFNLNFSSDPVWASDNQHIILYFDDSFWSVDSRTGEEIIISGDHYVNDHQWAVSPVATTP